MRARQTLSVICEKLSRDTMSEDKRNIEDVAVLNLFQGAINVSRKNGDQYLGAWLANESNISEIEDSSLAPQVLTCIESGSIYRLVCGQFDGDGIIIGGSDYFALVIEKDQINFAECAAALNSLKLTHLGLGSVGR